MKMINSIESFARLFDDCFHDYSEEVINKFKEHKKPIVLFGTGEVASRVLTKLKRHNIEPDYQMVDPEYEKKVIFKYPNYNKTGCLDRDVFLLAGIKNYLHVESVGCELGIKEICFLDNLYDSEYISHGYFEKNLDGFFRIYENLVDDESKRTLIAYLKTNLTHDPRYMFPVWDQGLQYFSFTNIKIGERDIFVNCGAYDGDTIRNYIKTFGGDFTKIYALEADKYTFKLLSNEFAQDNIIKINKAVYSDDKGIQFKSFSDPLNEMSRGMSKVSEDPEECTQRIETCTIDDIVCKDEKITFINMDIEGAEVPALNGARNTIIKDKPQMAISIYHKEDDLIRIPELIKSFDETYKFALRAYCPWSEELVLYAYH